MRIFMFTDPHWSTYSSILRKRGSKYSVRLENLIQSLNWVEETAEKEKCDAILCLGDFFDKPELSAEEITALKEIKWSSLDHKFIVGNHESNINDLIYSSTNCLLGQNNFEIIDKPTFIFPNLPFNMLVLPYIVEEDRKPLKDYLVEEYGKYDINKNNIIFSHNDIAGIQYGKFESKEGFNVKDIEENSKLFFNGHLHNGCFVNDKQTILNLGNLTGQNFQEDASVYEHLTCILDIDETTSKIKLDFIENPYAFNFYKLNIDTEKDINKLDNLKTNSVLSIKCEMKVVDKLKEELAKNNNITTYKLLIYREVVADDGEVQEEITQLNKIDYLSQFSDCVIQKLGADEIVKAEIAAIIGG